VTGSGQWIERGWDITEIPLFARAGAVIASIPFNLGDTLGLAARQYVDIPFIKHPYPLAFLSTRMLEEQDCHGCQCVAATLVLLLQ
jgi:hypothetical protein